MSQFETKEEGERLHLLFAANDSRFRFGIWLLFKALFPQRHKGIILFNDLSKAVRLHCPPGGTQLI